MELFCNFLLFRSEGRAYSALGAQIVRGVTDVFLPLRAFLDINQKFPL